MAVGACVALPATAVAGVVPVGYPHPQAAPSVQVSLVPAFHACAAPNRTHQAPLAFPSCSPPAQTSGWLTVGTPDANAAGPSSVARARWKVVIPPGPDAPDVLVTSSLTDVRCRAGTQTCGTSNASDGPDYTGEVELRVPFRLTDRFNAVPPGGGTEAATVIDITFPITFACAASASTSAGSTCETVTTLNVVVPGAIQGGKRAIWELGPVSVWDGGSDGRTETVPNSLFALQGVFVP